MKPSAEPATRCRWAITVRGVVQGVGFRPFIYNAARSRELTGWVQNRSGAVRIEAEGEQAALEELVWAIRHHHPPQARIDAVEVQAIPCLGRAGQEDGPAAGFAIRASLAAAAPQPTIPADLATCDLCLAEIHDAGQRRWRYPFTNCTNCGPRWSIIRQVPYDRPRTSMAEFALCPDCAAEYTDPSDRRFHAQPIACPRCGPALELLDGLGRRLAVREAALEEAARSLLDGRVLAMKGLGGFQLLVDATNAVAVGLLRRRKRRPDRPFALMFPTLDEVRRHCELSAAEAQALQSPEAPILLLRRRGDCPDFRAATQSVGPKMGLSPLVGIAPGNPNLGVMLPYTPLHHLLLEAAGRPLVCTSGNLSEEPMAISTEEAIRRLGSGDGGPGIADLFLVHDRPIVRPVDDSVARLDAEGMQVLRRARGYAPLSIALGIAGPTTLAVGGHLKNTVALGLGSASGPVEVVLSPHVGDLDSLLGVEVFRRAIDDLVDFFAVAPEVVACDLHPDYASTRHAEELARRWGVPLLRVQHHYAHVAACMAEHGLEGPVLGFAWDGTGYGTDGTIWGGEALVCQRSGFVRAAHLRTFPLPGGDPAMRQPRRSALGLLYEILGGAEAEAVLAEQAAGGAADWFSPAEVGTLRVALARSVNTPRTEQHGTAV